MEQRERALTAVSRPIFVASYASDAPARRRLRENFPPADADELDGESDGYIYQTVFAGSSLEHTYQMVVSFLQEEGYGDVPLPRDAAELQRFRLPTRNKQILLFADNGYVHNPVKILFPLDGRKRHTLILRLHHEQDPDHLLKFHGLEP